ncbi:MAG: carbohydrate kinase family protein [Fibrobacteres bacterium]|nr:carbohydrate kinase family protein [Fibrobacterota bacterium]
MAGIACAGNWIIDRIKTVDRYPAKGELANILTEEIGPGGSPFNILGCFAKMKVGFPLLGFGCIGTDATADQIFEICEKYGIPSDNLIQLSDKPTSFTDVMSVHGSGERTFFHARGANSGFNNTHVNIDLMKKQGIKLFHLGYLLLLDSLDAADASFGTVGARLLSNVRAAGIETSLDLVTEQSEKFSTVHHALPHVDYLIINELETERISGMELRNKEGKLLTEKLPQACKVIFGLGVNKAVVIHAPEGVLWADREGSDTFVNSLNIPKEHFVGTTGAGDACCTGILLGIHEKWPIEDTLRFSTGTAAACIGAKNTVDGMRTVESVRKLCRDWIKK